MYTFVSPMMSSVNNIHLSNDQASEQLVVESSVHSQGTHIITHSYGEAFSSQLPKVIGLKGYSSSHLIEVGFLGSALKGIQCSVFVDDQQKLISYAMMHGLDTLFLTYILFLHLLVIYCILSSDCMQNAAQLTVFSTVTNWHYYTPVPTTIKTWVENFFFQVSFTFCDRQ
jgi:hypothetical protein